MLSVRCRRAVGRVPGDVRGGFCRGIELSVHLDEDRFSGSGVFLFASVLERFLGLYCNHELVFQTDCHHQPAGRGAATDGRRERAK